MDIIVRAAIMFVFLFLLLRLMGKRELGQMTPFELVVIIVMGDLNDDPNNISLTSVLLAKGDIEKIKDREFYNPLYEEFKNGNGTLAYRDSWNLFDQIVVSKTFTAKRTGSWQFYKPVIFRQPWMLQTEGAFKGYPFRTFVGDNFMNGYSDHLPVYLYFLKRR